jgi:SAM-dependent methyltransferase
MDNPDILKPIAGTVVRPLHDNLVAGRRVRVLSEWIAGMLPPGELSGLDVGCGDGGVGRQITVLKPEAKLAGVDVLVRPGTLIPVTRFDGEKLEFPDNAFDFSILVDVLHHTEKQQELLAECLRVSRKFVIIKDHLCETPYDDIRLRFMDWVGNKAHGVHLPYLYLSSAKWNSLYEKCNAKVEETRSKLHLYPAPATWIFDDGLHFISKIAKRN